MAEEKVIRIPISSRQRRVNERGAGYVECEVTSRWLQFHGGHEELDLIPVDVMTEDKNGKDRKICELVLRKEDLLKAINIEK
ncbi:hypothetical protein [Bacillus cereus]|uniref:hypothetical protein n=1 Tax=Bacillus TaxID=1386 RepID=UPI0035C6A89C